MEMTAQPDRRDAELRTPARQERSRPVSRAAEFATARSHSRRVRRLKFALPVAALLLAAGFVGYAYLSSPLSIAFDLSNVQVQDGKLVMTDPKLDGFTKLNLPYTMRAARALQNLDSTGMIELEDMKARVPVGSKGFADIDASRGVYDRDKNTLDISSSITVTTTDGKAAKLQSAFIELGKGTFSTDKPVEIALNGTNIAANSMSVLENGKVLVFEKKVKLNIVPGTIGVGQQANGEPNAAN